MTFKQRLKFYLVGFGMGILVLMIVLNKRGCKGISAQKMEELTFQKWDISDVMRCKLQCAGFAADSLFLKDVKTCKVNYSADATNASLKPCGNYVLESTAKSAATYTLLVSDCDSTTKLLDIIVKTNCSCK
ncbi:MAG TPA: hypothetical protein VN698_01630 [Bacteroidia bacterium]|nr:hypothetical protein [Bacteroidia bacterium]